MYGPILWYFKLGKWEPTFGTEVKAEAIITNIKTGITCILKVCVRPLRFYERPMLVPVFANWRKLKEEFRFYEKLHLVCLFCTS